MGARTVAWVRITVQGLQPGHPQCPQDRQFAAASAHRGSQGMPYRAERQQYQEAARRNSAAGHVLEFLDLARRNGGGVKGGAWPPAMRAVSRLAGGSSPPAHLRRAAA